MMLDGIKEVIQYSQLKNGVPVSVSVFVGLISSVIIYQVLKISVYSCRTWNSLQYYNKIFKNSFNQFI